MIDTTIRRCRQRLGCLQQILEYLGTEGLSLAYHACPCNFRIWRDITDGSQCYPAVQIGSYEALCQIIMLIITLQRHCHAAAIGLLCKLLDGTCQEHLQLFCLALMSSISLPRCLNIPRPYLLANPITTTSLDLFR